MGSRKFLVGTLLVTLPVAGFLMGKGRGLKMENPPIVIDTTEVDCGEEKDFKVKEEKAETSVIEEEDEDTSEETESDSLGQFVASKNGKKYYPVDCSLVNRIKEENRVYYESEEKAQADGKELTSGCK